MRRYKRHQLQKEDTLFGAPINVVYDPDWVEQAIHEFWFTISKSKGIWRVYFPYVEVFDYLNADLCNKAHTACREIEAACEQVDVKARSIWAPGIIHENEIWPISIKAKFQTKRQIEDFISIMSLKGYTYVPSRYIDNYGER